MNDCYLIIKKAILVHYMVFYFLAINRIVLTKRNKSLSFDNIYISYIE